MRKRIGLLTAAVVMGVLGGTRVASAGACIGSVATLYTFADDGVGVQVSPLLGCDCPHADPLSPTTRLFALPAGAAKTKMYASALTGLAAGKVLFIGWDTTVNVNGLAACRISGFGLIR